MVLQGRYKFRVKILCVVIDGHLTAAPARRIDAFKDVRSTFEVITHFRDMDSDSVRQQSMHLASKYCSDIQCDLFSKEMMQSVLRVQEAMNC